MWRSPAMSSLLSQLSRARVAGIEGFVSRYGTMAQSQLSSYTAPKSEKFHHQSTLKNSDSDAQHKQKNQIGKHVSGRAKVDVLLRKLSNLEDSKETVYGALDSWVAWEQKFPIVLLKNALVALEKEQQWHRIIQIIKWMLSKGQGNTMGTCGQLILALDMDNRAEEAHTFWVKKIGIDLHSVSWQLRNRMMAIYNRNNKSERLIKLFKGLEAFDRKPPDKTIVRKVANAFEVLGMLDEKDRVLEKYSHLFIKREKVHINKPRDVHQKKTTVSEEDCLLLSSKVVLTCLFKHNNTVFMLGSSVI
ncbi:hypothetical protein K2173_018030 [Erythroxylum novogranatense]|uniref:Pentatricopeptide repeat-containing protein n=1 Tax=Erythroxylum novogranatense TaxID=1862640 RepID=A0AAV8TWW7_9ROSI|nr:hypothetical protein K2173_018030 [Erythroxylum novogranatense]